MPQTDHKGPAIDKLALLQKGIINFNDPKASDAKIKEAKRFQKLAGIIKG